MIGDVMGKYRLAISDVWIHGRIEQMMEAGMLEVAEEAGPDMPVYRRKLRKRKQNQEE